MTFNLIEFEDSIFFVCVLLWRSERVVKKKKNFITLREVSLNIKQVSDCSSEDERKFRFSCRKRWKGSNIQVVTLDADKKISCVKHKSFRRFFHSLYLDDKSGWWMSSRQAVDSYAKRWTIILRLQVLINCLRWIFVSTSFSNLHRFH